MTYKVFRWMMWLGAFLIIAGLVVWFFGFLEPIANFNAQLAGASFSGTDLPPGLVLILLGLAISFTFGWLSNDRERAQRSGRKDR